MGVLQPYPLQFGPVLDDIDLDAGEHLVCHWYNVPDDEGGDLTLIKYTCSTEEFVSEVDCQIEEDGKTFDLSYWTGTWDLVGHRDHRWVRPHQLDRPRTGRVLVRGARRRRGATSPPTSSTRTARGSSSRPTRKPSSTSTTATAPRATRATPRRSTRTPASRRHRRHRSRSQRPGAAEGSRPWQHAPVSVGVDGPGLRRRASASNAGIGGEDRACSRMPARPVHPSASLAATGRHTVGRPMERRDHRPDPREGMAGTHHAHADRPVPLPPAPLPGPSQSSAVVPSSHAEALQRQSEEHPMPSHHRRNLRPGSTLASFIVLFTLFGMVFGAVLDAPSRRLRRQPDPGADRRARSTISSPIPPRNPPGSRSTTSSRTRPKYQPASRSTMSSPIPTEEPTREPTRRGDPDHRHGARDQARLPARRSSRTATLADYLLSLSRGSRRRRVRRQRRQWRPGRRHRRWRGRVDRGRSGRLQHHRNRPRRLRRPDRLLRLHRIARRRRPAPVPPGMPPAGSSPARSRTRCSSTSATG